LLSQDALTLIGVKAAIEEIGEAKPVKVAVLATGVTKFEPTSNGETLEGHLAEGRSFIPGEDIGDKNGHGTWIASLVAVIAPKAQIISVKVLSNKGMGPESSIIAGLNYATLAGARIVILPFNFPATNLGEQSIVSADYTALFKAMRDKGVLVFTA